MKKYQYLKTKAHFEERITLPKISRSKKKEREISSLGLSLTRHYESKEWGIWVDVGYFSMEGRKTIKDNSYSIFVPVEKMYSLVKDIYRRHLSNQQNNII